MFLLPLIAIKDSTKAITVSTNIENIPLGTSQDYFRILNCDTGEIEKIKASDYIFGVVAADGKTKAAVRRFLARGRSETGADEHQTGAGVVLFDNHAVPVGLIHVDGQDQFVILVGPGGSKIVINAGQHTICRNFLNDLVALHFAGIGGLRIGVLIGQRAGCRRAKHEAKQKEKKPFRAVFHGIPPLDGCKINFTI